MLSEFTCVIYLSIDNVSYDIQSVLSNCTHKTIVCFFDYNRL